MFTKILLIFLSLCVREGFPLPSVDQLLFPIYDNSQIYFHVSNELRNNHPLKHDVKRVRRLNFNLREGRLNFYDKDPEPDDYPEEYDLYHRLVALDFFYDKDLEPNDYPQEYDLYHRLVSLDFIGLIEQYAGYTPEEHFVSTNDGYNLTLHRISGSSKHPKRTGKPVIFIQHGLFMSSDAYVLKGPEKDLAFRLVNQGYDVWFGNARGNSYSRSFSDGFSNSSDFWNFSFHEIGIYDLRASIDYVLEQTGRMFLTFIGYSIGATESYILLANYPEYNEKINLLIGISPFAFWEKPAVQDSKIQNIVDKIKKVESDTGSGELYPQSSFIQYMGRILCSIGGACKTLLSNFFGQLYSDSGDYVTYINITSYVPAGTSAKTLYHLLQIIESGNFQEYDDGSKFIQNYDLTKITAPIAIFSGSVEHFIYKKDVDELQNRFSTAVIYQARSLEFGDNINNLDFPWIDNVNDFHTSILSILRKF